MPFLSKKKFKGSSNPKIHKNNNRNLPNNDLYENISTQSELTESSGREDYYAGFLRKLSQSPSLKKKAKTNSTDLDEKISKTLANTDLESDDLNSSLSQQFLNQSGVKEAYKKHVAEMEDENPFDFMKNFQIPKKGAKRIHDKNVVSEKNTKQIKNLHKKVKINKESEENKKAKGKDKKVKVQKLSVENPAISVAEQLELTYEIRNVGLYAICDKCNKARYLPDIKDPLDLPQKWYCYMNPDEYHNNCKIPEEIEDEESLINNLYNAGSIVWAKVEGYPWWPAMVDDDPDYGQYFWLEQNIDDPTMYHVTFFGTKVTRAWLKPTAIAPFKTNMKNALYLTPSTSKSYTRVESALKQAKEAVELPLINRLQKYNFVIRYKPGINDLKKKKEKHKKVKAKTHGKKCQVTERMSSIDISDFDFSLDWETADMSF